MFYDFSIPYKNDKTVMMKLIQRAKAVGYDVIAINNVVDDKLSANHVNPIPKLLEEIGNLDKSFSFTMGSKDTLDVPLECPVESEKIPPTIGASGIMSRGWQGQKKIRILSRLTLVLSDPSRAQTLKACPSASKQYDIIAVRPTNESILSNALLNLDIDLVSIDMSRLLTYFFKHHTVQPARERGIYFEIPYSPAIRDSNARKNVFYNANNLIRALNGENLIFVSQAEEVIELRGPYDIANLGSLFSINQSMAKNMVSSNSRSLLLRAETRKFTEKAVISVVGKVDGTPQEKWRSGGDDTRPSKKPRFETEYNSSKIDSKPLDS